MNLCILIPCHKRIDLLHRAIAVLGDHPVLVVDDSQDGLALDEIPHVRTSGSRGFARSVNRGLVELQKRGFSHVLLLNDDVQVEPQCIPRLKQAWSESDGAIAPVLQEPDGALSSGFLVGALGRIRVRPGTVDAPAEVDAVSGAAILMRCTERLDEGYRHGFEDLDLCRRLRLRGLRVRTIPSARCLHDGGATVSRTSRYAQRAAVSGHIRYLGGGWRSGLAVALGVGQVLREGGSPQRLLGVWEGWRDHRQDAQSSAVSACSS